MPTNRMSLTLAAVRTTATGTPRPSQRTWRLVPSLPRSVGLGPVRSPLLAPSPRRCRGNTRSNRYRAARRNRAASRRTSFERRQPWSTRRNVDSKCCDSQTRRGSHPTDSRCVVDRECRSSRCGRRPADDRLSDYAVVSVSKPLPGPKARRGWLQSCAPFERLITIDRRSQIFATRFESPLLARLQTRANTPRWTLGVWWEDRVATRKGLVAAVPADAERRLHRRVPRR